MIHKIALKKWLVHLFVVLFALIVIVMTAITIFTKQNLRRQATVYNEGLVDVYMEQLDKNISGVDRLLSQYLSTNYDISTLALSDKTKERVLAAQNIMRRLKLDAFAYNMFTGFFVYSQSTAGNEFLCQNGQDSTLISESAVRSIVEEELGGKTTNGWKIYESGGNYYMLKVVNAGSSSCGAWMDLDALSLPLDRIDFGKGGGTIIADMDGRVLLQDHDYVENEMNVDKSGEMVTYNDHKYLQITSQSETMPIAMSILISDSAFSKQLYFVQGVILLLSAVLIVAIPVLWRLLDRHMTRPVQKLVDVMNEVQKGDFTVHAKGHNRFLEFDRIFDNFNIMVDNIRQLKEDVYDRQLREQKTQLQYLQLQIRPHFFLNILNVIYSFSLVGQNELIEKLTISLSKYFRYLFRSNVSLVTLGAECEHIKNYMDIQKVRYSGSFDYDQEVDEVLMDALLPPLVLQTFVENSIKYASDDKHFWFISLTGEVFNEGNEQKLRLVISDNGPGYPEAVLEAVRDSKSIGDDPEKQIGIINVKQRLNLMYGKNAALRLYNQPDGGAVSEVILPLTFENEDETEGDGDVGNADHANCG